MGDEDWETHVGEAGQEGSKGHQRNEANMNWPTDLGPLCSSHFFLLQMLWGLLSLPLVPL